MLSVVCARDGNSLRDEISPFAAVAEEVDAADGRKVEISWEASDGADRKERVCADARTDGAESPSVIVERERPGRVAGSGIAVLNARRGSRRYAPRRKDESPRDACGAKRRRHHGLRRRHHNQMDSEGDEQRERQPRQDPVRPAKVSLRSEIEQNRPVENSRGTRRKSEPRKRKADTGATPEAMQRKREEREMRPADEPPALGEERQVRADQGSHVGNGIREQEHRGQRARIAEPHAVRVHREESQPREPDLRAVQDRTVKRETRSQPPKGKTDCQRGDRPLAEPFERAAAAFPLCHRQPRRPLQGRDNQSRPRLRQEQHREQQRRKATTDPRRPPPPEAQRQQCAGERRRMVGIVEAEGEAVSHEISLALGHNSQ